METIRVRISSEAAGDISMTPVVVRELEFRELVEVLLTVCGAKDIGRISELLARGSIVEGASRFRWPPFEADAGELRAALAQFPDPDPARLFDAARCSRVRLCGPKTRIDLPRELASARRLFQRQSLWDVLMAAARKDAPGYAGYSYRERADLYRMPAPASLSDAAGLCKYAGLARQITRAGITAVELAVPR